MESIVESGKENTRTVDRQKACVLVVDKCIMSETTVATSRISSQLSVLATRYD